MKLDGVGAGHTLSLMDSLGFLLKHIILTMVFANLKAPAWMLPPVLRKLGVAAKEFKLYMEEAVLRHMQSAKTNATRSKTRMSLLEAMINANESEKQQLDKPTSRPSYLTDSELYGNIFVFNMAGYETTAATMTFALSFLAAHPQVQAWVTE
jgi:cytochrome P450